jgi:sugar O-acyltransferase (sialic acid O-acetyltransferase NeuD family)
MYKGILLIGGGGHCKSVIDTISKTNQYSHIGVIDKEGKIGESILGVPIIGCDDELPRLFQAGFKEAFVTVGSVGNPKIRIELFRVLEKIGFKIPNIVDITALISNDVKLDKGIFVGKNAVINAGSCIHNGATINTSAVIEHDCIIEEFSHIAPGALLCGEVKVGKNTHIGARSVIRQQIKIGSNSIIGMGSTVLKDIGTGVVAYGNPCKEVQPK